LGLGLGVALALGVGCGRARYDATADGGSQTSEGAIEPLIVADALAAAPFAIAPALDGTGVVVAFAEFPAGASTPELVLVRADAEGAITGRVVIESLARTLDMVTLQTAADGYRLFYQPEGQSVVELRGLDAAGELAYSDSLADRREFFATATETGYAAAFRRTVGSFSQVHVELLDSDGRPNGASVQIEAFAEEQDRPVIGYSGGQLGVAWRDNRSGSRRARFAIADASGAVVVPSAEVMAATGGPRTVLADGADGFVFIASLAADGTVIARLDSAGAALWPTPVELPLNLRESQDLGFGRSGDTIALAWQNDVDLPLTQIDFQTLSIGGGALTGSQARLSEPEMACAEPALAAVGDRFAVVFYAEGADRRGPYLRWSDR